MPVTTRVISHDSVSMRIDRSTPSGGIHATDSNGISPDMTGTVCAAACTNAAVGSSAAMRNARAPRRCTSHGITSGTTANAARRTSMAASSKVVSRER